MKKFLISFLLLSIFSNLSFADQNCDWSLIKKLPDGGYEYSPTLNICVGQLVESSKIKDQQISDLTKAISLKDLALTNADARTALWQTNADNEMDRLNKIDSEENHNAWLYFSLGVATTFLAAYGAAKIAGR